MIKISKTLKKLHNRLTLLVGILIIIIVLLFFHTISYRMEAKFSDTVLENIFLRTDSISRRITKYVYSGSIGNAYTELKSEYFLDKDLIDFAITDTGDTVLVSLDENSIDRNISDTFLGKTFKNKIIFNRSLKNNTKGDYSLTIFNASLSDDKKAYKKIRGKKGEKVFYSRCRLHYQGMPLGDLHIIFSRKNLDITMNKFHQTIIFTGLLILIVILLVIYFFLKNSLKPLDYLTHELSKFKIDNDKNVKEQLATINIDQIKTGTSEISNLKNAFITMTDALTESYTKLDKHRSDLHKLVETRTNELMSSNTNYEKEIKERKQIEKRLKLKNSYMSALHKTTLEIISHLDTKLLLDTILKRAEILLNTHNSVLSIYNAEDDTLQVKIATGNFSKIIGEISHAKVGVVGEIWKTKEPLLVNDYSTWEKRDKNHIFDTMNSTIGIPIKTKDTFFGVIGFAHFDSDNAFGDDDLYLIKRLSELASIALTNSNLHSEVRRQLSEIKKIEKEKNEIYKHLLHAQKMEALGTLAGGMAHDINNLLMAIQGNVSLMELNVDHDHPNIPKLENIKDLVSSGSNLTKQLLGFARGGQYETSVININKSLQKSTTMFGRTRKNITIHEDYEMDIWPVETDHTQIEQVILNLFLNASQAIKGTGDIYLKTENCSLHENFVKKYNVPAGKYVKISVTDTGSGIDKSIIERIFEPFFTTKEIGRNTGLGLASSFGIIKKHKGIIDVESELGEKTAFSIYLPASKNKSYPIYEKPENTQAKQTTAMLDTPEKTVLVIDDEEIIRNISQEFLESFGYNPICAASGKEGIEIYRENTDLIDLIILDLIMPDMSGLETYDCLKEINPHTRILLSSGYNLDGEAEEIMEKGCNGFIQKPYIMEQLQEKIVEIINS